MHQKFLPIFGSTAKLARLIFLSGLGIFSGGLAIAQTSQTIEPDQVTPIASPSLAPPNLALPAEPEPVKVVIPTEQPAPAVVFTPNNFADPNDYGLTRKTNPAGLAADPSELPQVVITERSTGCTNIIAGSNLPASICPKIAASPQPPAAQINQANQINPESQPVNFLGIEVAPEGLRPASSPNEKTNSFFSRQRPTGLPRIGDGTFMFPLTIPAVITSLFGWRIHPISGAYSFHAGTDLGAPQGTPVVAAVDGRVELADFLGGYGLTVVLRHSETQESLYAHLSRVFVRPGERVSQGTVIGLVGSTGNSTGPHLHFEWRALTSAGWVPVNSDMYLKLALEQFLKALENSNTRALFSQNPRPDLDWVD